MYGREDGRMTYLMGLRGTKITNLTHAIKIKNDYFCSLFLNEDIMRTTEQTSRYDNLDRMSTKELLTSINAEDMTVPLAVAKAIPQIVMQQLACGKKFDLPTQEKMVGSIYLANNPGKVKDVQIRDPKTQENLGTATITTQDSIQVRVKSPVPQHLSTKVRKDVNGKVVNQ